MPAPARRAVPLLAALALLPAGLVPRLATADTVYLTNGQVFEEVEARRDGDLVRIRMGHGEMGLPASWVDRIEEADSVLGGYLARKATLEPAGPAAEWLALARWARDRGFAEGEREAGLRAAALDPDLEGLAPILAASGYAREPETGEWLTEAERMARRGYVRVGAEWVPRSVVVERIRAAEAERAEAERRAREERLERAITLLALAQLENEAAEATAPVPVVPVATGIPVGVFAGVPVIHRPRPTHPPRTDPPPPRADPPPIHPPRDHRGGFSYEALAGRQPGSIIPLAADPGAERRSGGGR